jgi:polyisoprenoid-binding protein YceI
MEATKTTWKVDSAHSELLFKVKHMVISTVTGKLNHFQATVHSETADFNGAEVEMEAELASIDTNNADRDAHLRSADFFDAENHPKMRLVGRLVKTNNNYQLEGQLTLRDVTKPVTFEVLFNGVGQDPWGNTKAGFEVSGSINRVEYGLTWNAALETGGVLVSEQVRVSANLQLSK